MESDNVDISSKDKGRRPLHTLQPAANDNEALVGADRIIKSKSTHQLKEAKTKFNTNNTANKGKPKGRKKVKEDKAVQTAREEKVKIEVNDLISTDNPSENYWQVLAERRRIALENTLTENKRLEQYVESLEEKLHVYKEMLEETKVVVEVLQEMIEDNENVNNLSDDTVL
ncbi:geminin [Ooceraea biroi]|uniref:geminin n=1 Tax=Ooceraea biroi TaxID=2015173 RepID=UPI0005BC4DF9|nr:geminin [Ooceraea biroi]